jgi:hypothetical protein
VNKTPKRPLAAYEPEEIEVDPEHIQAANEWQAQHEPSSEEIAEATELENQKLQEFVIEEDRRLKEEHAALLERQRYFSPVGNPDFPIIWSADMWKVPRKAPNPILQNIIYPGCLTIVAGDPKAGKSTFLFNALDAAIQGKEFCGLRTNPVKAVYASEQSDPSLFTQVARVEALKESRKLGFIPVENNFRYADGKKFYPRNWSEQIVFWKEAIGKVEATLLVIDTFSAFAQFRGGEAYDSGPTTQRLQELKELVSEYPGLAIAINHHLRKDDYTDTGGDVLDRNFNDIANSYALRAASDMNVIIYKPSKADANENLRKIKVEGRLIEERFECQYRLLKNHQFVRADGDAKKANDRTEEQSLILKSLQASPELDNLANRPLSELLTKEHGQTISEKQVRNFRNQYPKGSIALSLKPFPKSGA